ncbi:putative membrane transport protein [plant metagenome]|uniref:Putative membrane transport protein n=2 Tax=root TaxID=1 RepID=A0A1C3JYF3_9BURK|nr:MFS transporter [Orrella dioscoreae]SBT24178.1 putative membrane transport protein [Orrella dioscoreae]SOE51365.1 putative membrane transport protein [Orrella dioscoreae]
MLATLTSFSSLYLASLLMMVGTGLFNTYVALRLNSQAVGAVWVGALIAGYYLGLVCGARMGHKLIIRVGHIRAYVACAAVATSMILLQTLVEALPAWLVFRIITGVAMVTQLMVIESWLNEQTENRQRGRVFSFYMLVSGLGTVLGQLALTAYPVLDLRPLTFVGICFAVCLVPLALTARSHPAAQLPTPLDVKFFVKRVPMSLTALFVAGNLSGAFYGLAPVYAAQQGYTTSQSAIFVAVAVLAGLLAQWPIGWLSDRVNRVGLIRFNALLLTLIVLPLWGWLSLPFWLLLTLSSLCGILLFTLYPLGAAFANDHVEAERRVGLAAVLLIVYGLGACVGPLIAGVLMDYGGSGMFFVFNSLCAAILVATMRPERVTGLHRVDEAPVHFVPAPDGLQASPMVGTLDPRTDPQADVYVETVAVDNSPVTEMEGPDAPPAPGKTAP